jgi:ribosomal protein S18 acetylase RimI-like enzyme
VADAATLDPTDARLALRAAQARSAVDLLACSGNERRALEPFGTVLASDLGVPTDWSVQLTLAGPAVLRGVTLPVPGELAAAQAWASQRAAGRGWLLGLPDPVAARLDAAAHGLVLADDLPVLAMGRAAAAELEARGTPDELEIGPPHDLAELHAAYGGWMEDLALAEGLVCASDLTRARRRFLVGRLRSGRAREVVGCAMVWFAGGTAYLSGLGVLPQLRGQGFGRALAVEAARVGAAAPVDVVWMYATDAGARLYESIGFRPVGSLVRFGPAA